MLEDRGRSLRKYILRGPSASQNSWPTTLLRLIKVKPLSDFWLKAGKRAAKTGANLEAIARLRRGLEVVAGNPGYRAAMEKSWHCASAWERP